MGDSANTSGLSALGKGDGAGTTRVPGASPPPPPMIQAGNALRAAAGGGGEGPPPAYTSNTSSGGVGSSSSSTSAYNLDMFRVGVRLELPSREMVQEFAKFSMGEINCFAVSLKKSDDLLLLSDHHWSTGLNEAGSQAWCMKRVPWFQDPLKRITALSFDDEGTLYIGTLDGNVVELKALRVLSDQRDSDLNTLYRLLHKIVQILVWNQDNHKILLCVGSHGNLAIISGASTPVNVSFTSSILRVELFQNKVGLTCALVCLESGQNVYTVLDDLDLPSQQNESQQKKSIFRKAKDNLMSRLSEDKLPFFSSKRSKQDSPGGMTIQGNPNAGNTPNVTITMSGGGGPQTGSGGTIGSASQQPGASSDGKFTTPVATGSGSASVKFQSLEEFHCRGELRKVKGRSQFSRHTSNKIDIFDDDFRQVSSVFVGSNITNMFVINRLYYCVDRALKNIRVSLVHNNSLKEIAVIPFVPRILSIETIGESPDSSCFVFIIAEDGIYELTLRKDPVHTCVSLLLRETSAGMLDSICNALNVSKNQVCAIAGDIKADEGKFSKSILYYKLAGLTYAQISAKFGSKGLMPAMLFFFELVDQEKTKLYGGFQDKQVMSDLALLGRIEQYLRYGSVRAKDMPRSPGTLVQKMLTNNIWYSSRRAAEWLSEPDLLWGLKLLGETRLCYPDVLNGLHQMEEEKLVECLKKNLIWKLMTQDWLSLYSTSPSIFVWFREIVTSYVRLVDVKVLNKLLFALLPWRRELQRKIFTEISSEVTNYASSLSTPKVILDDYVELFVIVLLEILRRKEIVNPLPSFVFKSDARQIQRMEIQNHKTNMVATLMLSFTFQKTLSASMSHVLSVRNGRVYAWGENKYGKLGVGGSETKPKSTPEKEKFQYHSPTPVNLSPVLKLHVESVCAGANHSVALTSVGTLLVWGQNNFGQLGIGPKTLWTARPVPLHIPDVIFTCVAAGSYHTVAVDHLNRVWTWGWGVYGQLGNDRVENSFYPQLVDINEKIVAVSAGHSHTAFLTCFGRVLTTGCNHFGQLGLGIQGQKVKTPQMVTGLPTGTLIRIVECGTSSTVMVSTKNRLFYSGLNPASLKSLLSSSRRKEKGKENKGGSDDDKVEEERDFSEPTMIDTSHMAGDIAKVDCSSTHFGVMSSLGYVYTWGVGKSGQLVRPDDDSKSLELIYSADEKMIIASDVCCAGDCTFVVEKESGSLFGCGFNSCGQLGKMESEDDQAVMMIRTKKRVVKVRQPSNIYFKLREIPGLPKQKSWETENSVMSTHKIAPPVQEVNQELLEWVIKAFRRNYDAGKMIQNCLKAENYQAASILETMAENYEQALQHNLAGAGSSKGGSLEAINKYLTSIDYTKHPNIEQACRFLTIVIHHWSKFSLPGCDLEEILEEQRVVPNWGLCLCSAMREVIMIADDSADWIADNLTPVFILTCISDGNKWKPSDEMHQIPLSSSSRSNTSGVDNPDVLLSSSNGAGAGGSSSSSASATSSTLNVLNGNVSFGSLCQSSASK